MKIRNRLKYWRHYLQIDTQTEYARILGVTPQQVSLWETQTAQPSLQTLVRLWKRLKDHIPSLNLQDLIEIEEDSTQ